MGTKISLLLTLFMSAFFALQAQGNLQDTVKSKADIERLIEQNTIAKKEYQHMLSHPKIIDNGEIDQMTNENLQEKYQRFVILYDAKKIEFNSLFVKTLIENEQIAFMDLSPSRAIIWADKSLNKVMLLNNLNKISMTPVTEFKQDIDAEN